MEILITSIMDVKKTAPNRLHHFIKHLSRNHRITVLNINQWWKAEKANINLYDEDFKDLLQNVEIKYFTERKVSPILQEVFSFINRGKLLNELNYNDFDVHFNYNGLISGYIIAKTLKSMGTGTIYDIADDLHQMIRTSPEIPSLLRGPCGIVGVGVIRKNIELASKVTVITNTLKNSYFVPQNKTEIIPNGVDIDVFKSYPSQQLREELGISQDFVIGYVGSLREWVDLEPLFAAVKQLNKNHSDIKILIVGEEGRFKENKDLAQKYNISDIVTFTGAVPYTQVAKYISCMDICLIPFKINAVSENALPLKLFEYMACEKPVVSIELKGVVEAARDKVLYVSNIEDYKDKIIALYNNEDLRKEMGSRGRKFVKENYSWSKIASKLEEVLNAVGGAKK